jgi:hypothetical protein
MRIVWITMETTFRRAKKKKSIKNHKSRTGQMKKYTETERQQNILKNSFQL